MKRGLISIVGLCLAVALFAAPAPGKPITLKFTSHLPLTHPAMTNGVEPYLKQIEEATKGRVQIERYWTGSLVKGTEAIAATGRGVADFGYIHAGYFRGTYKLGEIAALPFIPFPDTAAINGAMWTLTEKFPEIQQEHKKQNLQPLVYENIGIYFPMTTKKAGPIRVLEDWKGKKIRSLAGPQTDAAKRLGAVPLFMPASDLYVALERGTVDGAIFNWAGVTAFGFGEVCQYFTPVPISWGFGFLAMNLDKWNSMPKEIQDAIMSVSGKKGSELIGANAYGTSRQPAIDLLKKLEERGYEHELIYPSEEEIAKWVQVAGRPIWDSWIDRCVKAGYPRAKVKEILDTFLKLGEEYKQLRPIRPKL